MFDYSALAVDLNFYRTAKIVKLSEIQKLFTYFNLSKASKEGVVYPETIENQKLYVNRLLYRGVFEKELVFEEEGPAFDVINENNVCNFSFISVKMEDVISWGRQVGIAIPDDFLHDNSHVTVNMPESNWRLNEHLENKNEQLEPIDRDDSESDLSHLAPADLTELSGKDRRRLRSLETEKQKWDLSIMAAVAAGMYAAEMVKGEKIITRPNFENFLSSKNYGRLPSSSTGKIWDALPQEIKSKGGRPKGCKDVH
jgi:hypothetical protein